MTEVILLLPEKPGLMDRLLTLQKEFSPENVHVSLSPSKEITSADFPALVEEYVENLERLHVWIKNGHSTKGLPFEHQWKEIFVD